MEMHRRTRSVFLLAGLLSIFILASAVSAQKPKPAPSGEKYLEVGVLTDLTGPGSSLASVLFAWENLAEEYNETNFFGQGVKAKILWIDTKSEMGLALSAYERWRTRPKFIVQATAQTHISPSPIEVMSIASACLFP